MRAIELAGVLGLDIISQNGADREVKSCYAGDLLSWVMSRAVADSVWITIMSNVNMAAVAVLTDMTMVIIAESAQPDEGLVEKFKGMNTMLCRSNCSVYELAWRIRDAAGI